MKHQRAWGLECVAVYRGLVSSTAGEAQSGGEVLGSALVPCCVQGLLICVYIPSTDFCCVFLCLSFLLSPIMTL